MNAKNDIIFFDMSPYKETEGIRERCKAAYIEEQLQKRFPEDHFTVTYAAVNESGIYQSRQNLAEKIMPFLARLKGLPAYCDVRITLRTGDFSEDIIVWSPLKWNERFLGTCGGGTSTGGLGYFGQPDNTARGMTVPFGVMNGFSSATADAGNVNGFDDRMLDPDTREIRRELYENWRHRATNDMARFGKAVTEILHNKPIRYSYLTGGSGGGRQCLTQVQEYPDSFDGVWASCPAINWCKFVPESYYIVSVMQHYGNSLNPEKIKYISQKVRDSVGGDEKYYKLTKRVDFDAQQLVGDKTKGGVITQNDAKAMTEIWDGPHRKNGERMWYGFYPGGTFWNVGIPIGAFYYSLTGKKVRPFYLSTAYLRWVVHDPKWKCKKMTKDEFEKLFDESVRLYGDSASDKANISAFAAHGKLMVDHGTDDPLIPVEGTLDYYRKVCQTMGQSDVDRFFKLFIMPGDSHGNCRGKGGGMTASEGFTALMNWVENGIAPEKVKTVRVNMKGQLLSRSEQEVYKGDRL